MAASALPPKADIQQAPHVYSAPRLAGISGLGQVYFDVLDSVTTEQAKRHTRARADQVD
jgi:hypothetical protein